MTQQPRKTLRCAIYTRVSTEHGLEQEFNSLDNQREAAEAYVKSQAHEGWTALASSYDDGGFSGGNLERPGLQRLLGDIRERCIDVVVVYKVDRLTRSLADFAKLVELFDAHGVSFVSVTQAFNTTTSMGRLTLNVLLSFAQFEREVTGERIRDKIAASKRKGMRMGGPTPLGYDLKDKRLLVNENEAEQVRFIFTSYRELGSLTAVLARLRDCKVRTKPATLANGTVRGGNAFGKGALAYLLKNRVYVGEVVHKGKSFPGEHPSIVERTLFDEVQEVLASRAQAKRHARLALSPLAGRIFDNRGHRMTPVTANKGGVRYRYYVSCVIAQGRRHEAGIVPRVPAPEIEAAVSKALGDAAPVEPQHSLRDAEPIQCCESPRERDKEDAFAALDRVIVASDHLDIFLRSGFEHDTSLSGEALRIPWRAHVMKRRHEIFDCADDARPIRPISAQARARLLVSLAKARLWLDELLSGKIASIAAIAAREARSERSIRMTIDLAFLSPDIIKAAIGGALPQSCSVSALGEPQLEWRQQEAAFGID
jgi:site-specific DNA recombinase